jgi:hypothetical protein
MSTKRSLKTQVIYQLKVTLEGVRPRVWRRLLVPGVITLNELHDVLQVAMGWTHSHLHRFTIGDADYGAPDDEGFGYHDERRHRLADVAREKDRFIYEYDFGDSWSHEILVEKVFAPEPGARYPRCLAGARACPPEDCGGAWGYREFLAAIKDPAHEDHAEMVEWAGEGFDPEAFSAKAVDAALSAASRRAAAG